MHSLRHMALLLLVALILSACSNPQSELEDVLGVVLPAANVQIEQARATSKTTAWWLRFEAPAHCGMRNHTNRTTHVSHGR